MKSLRGATALTLTFFVVWGLAMALLGSLSASPVWMAILAAAGVAGAVAVFLYVDRRVLRPVVAVAGALERISGGDFASAAPPVVGSGEVAALMARFTDALTALQRVMAEVVGAVQVVYATTVDLALNADQSNHGAQVVAGAAEQMARGTQEQARSAEEVHQVVFQLQEAIRQIAAGSQETAVEVDRAFGLLSQMAGSIKTVAADAESVVEGAGKAAAAARTGAGVVGRTVDGMHQIREIITLAAGRIEELAEVSRQIGDITGAISEIAGQTNMLALNAAIEAARAGEHGRGFAVVAQEVRSLADRAGTSAKEIAALVERIGARTADAVQAMQTGRTEAEHGTRLAEEAGAALQEIMAVSERAEQGVRSISQAARQMREGASQVVQAFQLVAGVTQQNSATSEEMAAGADRVTASVTLVSDVSGRNASAAADLLATGEELKGSVEAVHAAASGLSMVVEDLQVQVANFKL
ncbi:MAG TPA: methyl-accepting chemotaxis protein [Symbiobacteriaceae bacterium]|nr:methyl-accepting chemotaxis protein [Symbiobacteriaceae bacterium]